MKLQQHIRPALALFALAFTLSPLKPARADSWTLTGPMNETRSYPTATLLLDGSVLVAGGVSRPNGVALSSAELYDPVTRTWTPTGPMNIARADHWATLLQDGRVLVEGGFYAYTDGSSYRSSAELYDPATGTWTLTGSMSVARIWHTATLLPNGQVLVAGGVTPNSISLFDSSAELYDPATGKWTPTDSMFAEHEEHTATLLANGQVLVAGGGYLSYWPGGTGFRGSTAELYDPDAGTWTLTGSMNQAREDHQAVLLASGQVLVAGGSIDPGDTTSSAELYDPHTGTWTPTGPMNTSRCDYNGGMGVRLLNGQVLVNGGELSTNNAVVFLATAELYDPASGTWTFTGPMSTPRYGQRTTLLPNGQVLVAGGAGDGSASAELYDSLRITVQPQSQPGYWGSSVTLSVTAADGVPPLTYQWFKDGVAIPNATNSTLFLTNLQPSDAGAYTVTVSDSACYSLTSSTATLTVRPAAVSIALYAGYAGLTIGGVVGQTYGIQASTNLTSPTSWAGLANVTLTNPTQTWYDPLPAAAAQRYYRVVPGPITIP